MPTLKITSKFKNLRTLLELDYKQLRALPCDAGHCATDEAIEKFVNQLIEFFSKFDHIKPDQLQLAIYLAYMKQITININMSEHSYYLDKYKAEYPDQDAETMATANELKSFKDIPKRMQFWAASEKWGDSIRNPEQHRKAIHSLNTWATFFTEKDIEDEPTRQYGKNF
jgi:hypothetical protein